MGDLIDLRKSSDLLARYEATIRLLVEWADWLSGYRMKIGFAPKSAGFQSGGVVSDSTDSDNYAAADNARCEIIDSCVDDLPPIQKAAINHRYCASVYRMRDYEQSLHDAHEALCVAFVRKGVMW